MTKEQIQSELKTSMLAKDELKTSVLRMFLAAVKQSETQGEKHDATEEDILELLSREIKKRQEAIEEYRKGNREELAVKEEQELAILKNYLPPQLTPDEVESIVKEAIKAVGAQSVTDFGKVMKEVTPKTKGKADGKTVSEVVKKLLG